eukprot:782632-Prorocentrum_lima.AAC.1
MMARKPRTKQAKRQRPYSGTCRRHGHRQRSERSRPGSTGGPAGYSATPTQRANGNLPSPSGSLKER